MKMFKKLSALLIAAVMVLAMAVPAMADDAKNGTITVNGVEEGATVKAARIIQPTADGNGYEWVSDVIKAAAEKAEYKLDYPEDGKPTVDAIATFVGLLDDKLFDIELTGPDKNGSYVANVDAGSYLVYIVGKTVQEDGSNVSHNIYNPMVLSVSMDGTGYKNGEVEPNEANAKKTTTDAGKKFGEVSQNEQFTYEYSGNGDPAHADVVKIGDTIKFELFGNVPNWKVDAYKTLVFRMTDTMQDDVFEKVSAPKVYIGDIADKNLIEAGEDTYELVPNFNDNGKNSFVINFKDAWLRKNQGCTVYATYTAVLGKNAKTGFDPNKNTYTLSYSHNPKDESGEDLEEIEEITNNYTLDISFKKVDDKGNALAGAGFTLYSDEECTEVVREQTPTLSGEDGMFYFKGLDEGTYYMKETTVPAGFTATGVVYKVKIEAKVSDTFKEYVDPENPKKTIKEHTAVLEEYTVSLEGGKGEPGSITVKGGKINDKEFDLSKDYVDQICNTRVPALPSTGGMGTYIFTIAGVAILAVAASMLVFRRRKEQ